MTVRDYFLAWLLLTLPVIALAALSGLRSFRNERSAEIKILDEKIAETKRDIEELKSRARMNQGE